MTNCACGLNEAPFCVLRMPAARTASFARSLCFGRAGAVMLLSFSTPRSGELVGCKILFPEVASAQLGLPDATPWQYWVVDVLHVSFAPYRPPKKEVTRGATPAGSLLVH